MTDDPARNPDGTMRKGFSANPGGRKPGSRNLITLFNEKRDERVPIKGPNGRTVMMSRQEAWITNMWNKAIACDPKASAQVVMLLRASGQLAPPAEGQDDLDENSAAVLEALVKQLREQRKD